MKTLNIPRPIDSIRATIKIKWLKPRMIKTRDKCTKTIHKDKFHYIAFHQEVGSLPSNPAEYPHFEEIQYKYLVCFSYCNRDVVTNTAYYTNAK